MINIDTGMETVLGTEMEVKPSKIYKGVDGSRNGIGNENGNKNGNSNRGKSKTACRNQDTPNQRK